MTRLTSFREKPLVPVEGPRTTTHFWWQIFPPIRNERGRELARLHAQLAYWGGMRGTGDRHKPLTMAEATAEFENILLHCNIQGYLYEPEYSEEELRRIEEEAAAAAAEQALPVAEEPDRAGVNWWCTCLLCSPMENHKESLCCSEFQRCQFLRDEMAESGEEGAVCVTSHPGFTPHLNRWVLDTYFRTQKVNWKRQPKPAGRNGRLSTE